MYTAVGEPEAGIKDKYIPYSLPPVVYFRHLYICPNSPNSSITTLHTGVYT
jgi:hypothetical protein